MKDDEFKKYMKDVLHGFRAAEKKAEQKKKENALPPEEHAIDFSFLKISQYKETIVWPSAVREGIVFTKPPLTIQPKTKKG